jgi:hypothetical protein
LTCRFTANADGRHGAAAGVRAATSGGFAAVHGTVSTVDSPWRAFELESQPAARASSKTSAIGVRRRTPS